MLSKGDLPHSRLSYPLAGRYPTVQTCRPGNHLSDVGSTGPAAAQAVDCLVCHTSAYDFRQRKEFKDDKRRVVMEQDRTKAALAIGKPTVKNCMVYHEAGRLGTKLDKFYEPTTLRKEATRLHRSMSGTTEC